MLKKIPIFLILICWGLIFYTKFSNIVREHQKLHRLYTQLKQDLSKELENFKGEVSLVIEDLENPRFKISIRGDSPILAASLIKFPLVCAVFKAQLEGKIDLSQEYILKRKDITGGSGILKSVKLPFKISYQKLSELAITKSDNTAANILVKKIGFDFINEYCKKWGLKNSKISSLILASKDKENLISAEDISHLLYLIYYKKILTPKICEKILHLLLNQKINDRIPKRLPKTVIVAHKTGLEKGTLHDAGIVFLPQRAYIICILTEKNKNYKKAKNFIARISEIVFERYEKYF